MTPAMKFFLCVILGLLAIVKAQVTSPSGGTVWTNGQTVTITWGSLSGSAFTIVLYRTGTVYHHTIVSFAPNTGSFSWQVEIPPTDGWPTTTSSDIVYEIDFYVNGGWNNGGQLVAKSAEFAIVWNGGGVVSTSDPTITTITGPSSQGGTITVTQTLGPQGPFITSVATETIVGLMTLTTVVTQVYQIGSSSLTTVAVPTTLTLSTTQQTQITTQTIQAVGTTIGVVSTTAQGVLLNSAMGKSINLMLLIAMGIVTGSVVF